MLKHTKLAFNDRVVCDRYSAPIHFCKATFIDQFTNTLQVGITGRKNSIHKISVDKLPGNQLL